MIRQARKKTKQAKAKEGDSWGNNHSREHFRSSGGC